MSLNRYAKLIFNINRIPEIFQSILLTKSWFNLTLAYLNIGKVDYPFILKTRHKQTINLNNFHDLVTAWVILCRREYKVPKEAKVILDLGANYGAFTLLAAHQAKKSQIISLEPFPKMFERLCENVASHQLQKRVTCLPFAIAKDSGLSKMSLEDGPDQSRGLLPENTENQLSVSVKTISLSELLEYIHSNLATREIDLVKMDIEGSEHQWLPEISASVLQSIRSWQMEYHPNGCKQKLFQALEKAGFICTYDYVIAPNCGVAYFDRKGEKDLY